MFTWGFCMFPAKGSFKGVKESFHRVSIGCLEGFLYGHSKSS